MRSWSPEHIHHLARRAVGGRAPIDDVASRREVLCPEEEVDLEPAIMLAGEEDKIVALHPETTRELEERRLRGGRVVHAPTIAHWIEGAKLRDFSLYKGRWSHHLSAVEGAPRGGLVRRFDRPAALATSLLGGTYFGHWLRDDVAAYLLAEEAGEPVSTRLPASWPHARFYAGVFGQSWEPTDMADFSEIAVFTDFSQNSGKVARYERLRSRMRAAVRPERGGHRVYLRRGDGGANRRNMTNEEELIALLRAEGFMIVDVVAHPIEDIAARLLDAALVVSIEGSHQNHALPTVRADGGLVTINPPSMFCNAARDWSAALGLKFGVVVGEQDGDGFRAPLAALMKTVERVEAAAAGAPQRALGA